MRNRLTTLQLEQYHQDGYLFLENFLDPSELDDIFRDVERLSAENQEGTVLEENSGAVRAMHGSHANSIACDRISRRADILGCVKDILETDVYLYQFKINMKAAFVGDAWPWHQDFIFWQREDGMELPQVVNVVLFLDPVTEFNGPIYLISRSHANGLIEPAGYRQSGTAQDAGSWQENVSANLKYQIPNEVVSRLVQDGELIAPKGGPGAVLFFHSNLVHGSAANMSPHARRIVIMTYNSLSNIPRPKGMLRPGFLVNHNATPIESV